MRRIRLLFAACALSAQFLFAENYRLENEKIRFEIDGSGRLVSLKNFETGREYTKGGGGLWRIIYDDGVSLEEAAESVDVPVEVEKKGEKLTINYGGEFPAKIECRLEGDDVRFAAEIKNASKNKILREFQFPLVNNLNLTEDSELILSVRGGLRYKSVGQFAKQGHTNYKWHEGKELQNHVLYPGYAAMNCMLVNEPAGALYIAHYDPDFGKALHFARLPNISKRGGREYGLPTLGIAKYPFLKPGESKKMPEYVVSPQTGDWHRSMKKYRAWADSWYKKLPAPKVFLDSNGWQRVIMRHQYGKILFGYDKIQEMYTAAEEAGFHTIRLYGWWREGMDAGNPNYSPDETQGGDAELARQIKAVQARGGKVVLYFNGQIIDTGTDFYKTVGKDICIKRFDGFPENERYPFGGDGTALRVFDYKTFAIACPSSKVWLEKLKWFADRAIALGADGIYYDQMGHDIFPCCDPNHGHPVPFMEINKRKHEMFKKVCEYIRAKKPEMSIGVEMVCDQISPLADYVHNGLWRSQFAVDYDRNGKPLTSHVQMYQYAFPEFATCDIGIYDDDDIPRSVNVSLMRSWRSDVSVFRCRETINAAPTYKAYLKKANALRDRFRDLILNGKFRDTDLAKCSNPKIEYSTFENGDRIAVVTTQSHLDSAEAVFTADGYEYAEHGGLGGFSVKPEGGAVKTEMKKDALIVIVFKKK